MPTQIQLRRDTAANWTSVDPTLAQGEFGVETDTRKIKIGDGTTAWTGLAYASGGGATGGGTDEAFLENDSTVTTNYTLSTGKNAVSAGPMTIDDGVTVTVPSGQSWVIV